MSSPAATVSSAQAPGPVSSASQQSIASTETTGDGAQSGDSEATRTATKLPLNNRRPPHLLVKNRRMRMLRAPRVRRAETEQNGSRQPTGIGASGERFTTAPCEVITGGIAFLPRDWIRRMFASFVAFIPGDFLLSRSRFRCRWESAAAVDFAPDGRAVPASDNFTPSADGVRRSCRRDLHANRGAWRTAPAPASFLLMPSPSIFPLSIRRPSRPPASRGPFAGGQPASLVTQSLEQHSRPRFRASQDRIAIIV